MASPALLSMVTVPKAFLGATAVAQTNALGSWGLLRPAVDVLLVSDDEGVAHHAAANGHVHVRGVTNTPAGIPMLDSVFALARARSRTALLAYVNADIILLDGFIQAVQMVFEAMPDAVMIGRRHNLAVPEAIDFNRPDWSDGLQDRLDHTTLEGPEAVDYFVFPKGHFVPTPPFVVGRRFYDQWLTWWARDNGHPVVDATHMVTCIHQDHGRPSPHSSDAQVNFELAGGLHRLFTAYDATHVLGAEGLTPASAAVHERWKAIRSIQSRLGQHAEDRDLLFPATGEDYE